MQNTSFSNSVFSGEMNHLFGLAMPGRQFNSPDYRFAFNGMEKDGEVNVTDNTYTTHFRMLDTRLGRWWSMDPVFKPYISTYNMMSNNPIWRIDPRGDDDYFSSNGEYLGNDGAPTNNIRIISERVYANLINNNSEANNIQHRAKLLTDYSFGNDASKKVLSNISTYYAHQAEINKNEIVEVLEIDISEIGDGFAAYDPSSDNFLIAIDSESKKVNSQAGNSKNLINSFSHEKDHQDIPTSSQPLGHVDVIINQSNHGTWKETTGAFQQAAVSYASTLLNEALGAGASVDVVKSKINEFNNSNASDRGFLDYNSSSNSVDFTIVLGNIDVEATK